MWSIKALPWASKRRNSVIFVLFFLSVSLSRCHPAVLVPILVLLGGPAVHSHTIHPSFRSQMSSVNTTPVFHSWESPTSKLGIWIIKVLFLASPLCATDLTLWSSPSPACTLSPHHCSLFISPTADRRFVQEAAADPESGGEGWCRGLLLILPGSAVKDNE